MEQIGGAANTAFCAFAQKLTLGALSRCGWEAKAGAVDGHTDKLLRATVLSLVETFCGADEGVLAECRRRFDAHWTDPAALPSDFKVRTWWTCLLVYSTYATIGEVIYAI